MKNTTYTFDETLANARTYFNGNELAADIWAKKYALRDQEGLFHESNPADMHRRIAKEFARIEKNYPNPMSEDEIFSLIKEFKYIVPQGSPMFGIGNPYQVISQSNCFAIATVDSYGGICRADERIAQISKRRGGCVEENSFVSVLGKGVIKIKEVQVGDHILSYNLDTQKSEYRVVLDYYYTDVEKSNQVKIELTNGFEIRTSKKHPVLVMRDGKLQYVKAGELNVDDICVIPEHDNPAFAELLKFDAKLTDVGWFIGAHAGDGALGYINKSWNKNLPKGLRLRMVGDNENVVKEFASICNTLTGSSSNYHVSTNKSYRTKCWEYINNTNALSNLAEKYFDNTIGRKCYSCDVFGFIERNNLWIPYLAGLIDTDGHVKNNGCIEICICAKKVVLKLSSVLAAAGVRCSVKEKLSKRTNEQPIYRLRITDEKFHAVVMDYLRHNLKHDKLATSQKTKRLFSLTYPFTENERTAIVHQYHETKDIRSIPKNKRRTNMMAIIGLLKRSCVLGFGGMMVLKEHGLLTGTQILNIMQRKCIKSITEETEDLKYIDISVEGNNNYYAGTKGLINIHNCGIDISPIRPKGLPTHNAAHTTDGIVVFMKRFSNTSKEVAQHGRRGALMISCSVHHPEIMSFIKSKFELDAITGANISVRLTDEFMNAVKAGTDYELRWPVDTAKPVMSTKVSAKEVWDEIVKHAFLRAEPGVLFWDNIVRNSPADCYAKEGFLTQTTNPCVTEDTWIMTSSGPRQVVDLLGKQFGAVVDGEIHQSGEKGFFKTGEKPVLLVKTQKGFSCRLTHDHLVQTVDFKNRKKTLNWKKAGELTANDKIDLQDQLDYNQWDGEGSEEEGWLVGSLIGDGVFTECSVVLSYWGKTRKYMHSYAAKLSKLLGTRADSGNGSGKSRENIKLDKSSLKSKQTSILANRFGINPDKTFGVQVERASSQFYKGFLRGWFDVDGTVLETNDKNSYAIRLASVKLDNLYTAQRMLARLGIISTVYPKRREAGYRMLPNGKGNWAMYSCQELHELHIGKSNLASFCKQVGFCDPEKQNKLESIVNSHKKWSYEEKFYDKVESVTPVGTFSVFDCEINQVHKFNANGVTLHNCSELPLAEGSSCILSVLNLCAYVNEPFSTNAQFDWNLFSTHVGKAMRLIDDLVDIEIESIKKIIAKVESDPEDPEVKENELSLWKMVRDKCISGRRTGLGITALGDAIAMMNYKYGDDNSIKFVEQMYSMLRDSSYRQSVILAKERGAFPLFDSKKEKNHPFLSRLPKDILDDMNKHGRRNIALLTTAPAGTISNLTWCGDGNYGTTSGFEPVYLASYTRKKKMSDADKGTPDSVAADGEKYRHFEVQHPGLKLFCTITGKKLADSPYAGAQAGEINHVRRVKMQSIASSFVDHAISSTVNLPNDISIETVAQIYMDAWEGGCKGITVYRDGSRDGILVSTATAKKDSNCENCDDAADKFKMLVQQGKRPARIIVSSAPKRPDILECDIIRTTIRGRGEEKSSQWVFLVGKLNNQPYEVFGGANDDLEIPKKFKTGWILKDGKHSNRTMYDLILGSPTNDGDNIRLVINNIAKVFSDYEHATFSRIASLCLRHGAPIKFICDQLTKDPEDDFQSYNRALARVLKSYIEEGEQSGLECPNCHAAKMVYKGGCPSCMVCGTSSCS